MPQSQRTSHELSEMISLKRSHTAEKAQIVKYKVPFSSWYRWLLISALSSDVILIIKHVLLLFDPSLYLVLWSCKARHELCYLLTRFIARPPHLRRHEVELWGAGSSNQAAAGLFWLSDISTNLWRRPAGRLKDSRTDAGERRRTSRGRGTKR